MFYKLLYRLCRRYISTSHLKEIIEYRQELIEEKLDKQRELAEIEMSNFLKQNPILVKDLEVQAFGAFQFDNFGMTDQKYPITLTELRTFKRGNNG